MLDSNRLPLQQHPDHVEPIGFVRSAVPVDPHRRRPGELALLPPMDRFHRISKLEASAGFHFHKRDRSVPFRDEIDVAVAVAESSLQNAPAPTPEPSLRYSLSHFAEFLPRR